MNRLILSADRALMMVVSRGWTRWLSAFCCQVIELLREVFRRLYGQFPEVPETEGLPSYRRQALNQVFVYESR